MAEQLDIHSNIDLQKDPYKILGISKESSLNDIKKAYFTLIKEYSPEKNPEAFKKIRQAYDRLRSEKRKEETDFLLFEEGSAASDFQKGREIFYNIQDDILDIEIWRLVQRQNTKSKKFFTSTEASAR